MPYVPREDNTQSISVIRVAKRSPWNRHLDDPVIVFDSCLNVPTSIPVNVEVTIVDDFEVSLVAPRRCLERHGATLVAEAVNRDTEQIVLVEVEIALQVLNPQTLSRLLADGCYIQRGVVKRQPYDRAIRTRRSLIGLLLHELIIRLSISPYPLIEATVDDDLPTCGLRDEVRRLNRRLEHVLRTGRQRGGSCQEQHKHSEARHSTCFRFGCGSG